MTYALGAAAVVVLSSQIFGLWFYEQLIERWMRIVP